MAVPVVYCRRDAGMESFIMNRRTYLLHALMFMLVIHGHPSLLSVWIVPLEPQPPPLQRRHRQ